LSVPVGAAYPQAGPGVHTVSMEAVRFSPAVLQVRVGDTIEWRNADPFPHNATAQSGSFRSGDIAPGQSWQFKAGRKGRFPYACTLHPGMDAVLVVE
ncbi:MAG TPA: plastocyanin/azurin family copper-binding protein, partial [Noviherbaspirillum sp.]